MTLVPCLKSILCGRTRFSKLCVFSLLSFASQRTVSSFTQTSRYLPTQSALSQRLQLMSTQASSKSDESSKVDQATKKSRKASPQKESPAKKPKKAPAHQVLTERDVLPKLHDAADAEKRGSYTFTVASWNVAGLRALLKKDPEALPALVRKYDVDVLCLQETKLQEQHLEDPKLKIGEILVEEGYEAHHSVSTKKKGYSGTAVFIRKNGKSKSAQKTLDGFFGGAKEAKEPKASKKESSVPSELLSAETVSFDIGGDHDGEGRTIVMDFPLFTLCNVYVPNSGQTLQRLDYRVKEWDKDFLAYMQKKQKDRGVPVMWLGDLNVAHTNLEVWNDGAKHLPKQAGVTPEERASFQGQLDAGFVDAFRKLHPTAKGHYSYWSQRAGNREPNKGLRLDYFICDPKLFDDDSRVVVRDSYCCPEIEGSDHCPVVVEMEIKKA